MHWNLCSAILEPNGSQSGVRVPAHLHRKRFLQVWIYRKQLFHQLQLELAGYLVIHIKAVAAGTAGLQMKPTHLFSEKQPTFSPVSIIHSPKLHAFPALLSVGASKTRQDGSMRFKLQCLMPGLLRLTLSGGQEYLPVLKIRLNMPHFSKPASCLCLSASLQHLFRFRFKGPSEVFLLSNREADKGILHGGELHATQKADCSAHFPTQIARIIKRNKRYPLS